MASSDSVRRLVKASETDRLCELRALFAKYRKNATTAVHSNDRWKRLSLLSWASAPCVWTLRNLLTYLLTYLLTDILMQWQWVRHTWLQYSTRCTASPASPVLSQRPRPLAPTVNNSGRELVLSLNTSGHMSPRTIHKDEALATSTLTEARRWASLAWRQRGRLSHVP